MPQRKSAIYHQKWNSVVVPHFAVVHRRAGLGIGHIALLHHGIDDPVIGALHPLLHPAAQKGQGIGEHWAPSAVPSSTFTPAKRSAPGGKRLRKWRISCW